MIRQCGFLAVLSIVVGAMTVDALAGYSGRKFRSGNWTGQARFADDGRFLFCSIHARYNRGNLLFFNLNRKLGASIGLVNPRWRLRKGSRIPISIFVDGRLASDSTAKVIARNHVVATFPTSRRMFSLLSRGRSMAISTDSGTMKFSLRGTGRALVRLIRCTEDEIRVAGTDKPSRRKTNNDDPFSGSGSGSVQRERPAKRTPEPRRRNDDFAADGEVVTDEVIRRDPEPEPREQPLRRNESTAFAEPSPSPSQGSPKYPRLAAADAVSFATQMLDRSGISRYTIIPRNKHPLKGFAVMWRTRGGIVGGLNAYRNVAAATVNKETAYRIATDTITCDGKFASGVKHNKKSPRQAVKRAFTACQGSKFSFEIHYTFRWTGDRRMIEVMNAQITKPDNSGPTDRLRKVDDRIHEALFSEAG